MPDKYFVLKDFESYYNTQKKVDELYQHPLKWAEFAIHNIAGMGNFSTDRSIQEYSNKIWGLTPCGPDPEILKQVREDYFASTPLRR
jgi:starch phosphorylase